MHLQPIGENFLFSFLNSTRNGVFKQKSSGKIYIPNAAPEIDEQGSLARWVRVEEIGELVTNFIIGDIVLVKPLRWTIGYIFDDVKLWKSSQLEVVATSDDEDVALDYKF